MPQCCRLHLTASTIWIVAGPNFSQYSHCYFSRFVCLFQTGHYKAKSRSHSLLCYYSNYTSLASLQTQTSGSRLQCTSGVGTQHQCATIKSGFPQQPSSRSNQIENLPHRTGIPPGDEEGGETGDGCRDDHNDGPNLDDDRVLLLTRLPSCDQSWRFPTW